MSKPIIYILGGSVRNHADEDIIIENIKGINSEPVLYEYIEHMGREGKISNSEGCAIAAAYGALQENVEVNYLKLNEYFLKSGRTKELNNLFEKLETSDGLIFSLPVYFGDRSSLFDELIENWRCKKLDLSGRIFGFLSVGAKRNGGQETTNIFGIQNVTELGGMAVGNGPPTSQFGGTAVGGNMGTMENDYFGIMTSRGTGKKVAQVSKILETGKKSIDQRSNKIKIAFLILKDKQNKTQSYIKSILQKKDFGNVEFNIIDLTEYKFSRCYACDICPNGEKDIDYKCINQKDDMKKLHSKIIKNDGIFLCGINTKDTSKVRNNYQSFIERTRYIRRDDFRLTNTLVSPFSLNEMGTHYLFNLRSITSFIRHNTIIHKGIYNYLREEKIIDVDSLSILDSFVKYCKYISAGREKVDIDPARYGNVGY